MPDKKLTDNEIIKALECCTLCECEDCPHDEETACKENLNQEVLELINRLQADNEELKRKIEDLESVQEISPEAKYLVDTKADKVISLLTEINKSQEQIKAEAYKEFAEKLKEDWQNNDYYWEETDVYKWIYNLLKELVGDNNAGNETAS